MSLKRILVALSLEDDSLQIARRAIQLASQHEAEIVAVHVIEGVSLPDPELPPTVDGRTLFDRIVTQGTSDVQALFDGAAVLSSVLVETGKPHTIIDALARSCDADLIVIGAGNAKTLREKIFGSTADRVIRRAPCPVLVVRGASPDPYRHLVIGVDFSDYARAAARHAMQLAPDASRELLHAIEIPLVFEQSMLKAGTPEAEIERYRKAKAKSARTGLLHLYGENGRLPKGARIRIRHGDAAMALLRAAQRRQTDLVAIGTQGTNAVAQHLLGSVARKVLAGAKCDVLVAPASTLQPT
jgi:nucleotide-binding universal stress UspA family protein